MKFADVLSKFSCTKITGLYIFSSVPHAIAIIMDQVQICIFLHLSGQERITWVMK
jgi:hypothetical protein